jgi:hypothetical protein
MTTRRRCGRLSGNSRQTLPPLTPPQPRRETPEQPRPTVPRWTRFAEPHRKPDTHRHEFADSVLEDRLPTRKRRRRTAEVVVVSPVLFSRLVSSLVGVFGIPPSVSLEHRPSPIGTPPRYLWDTTLGFEPGSLGIPPRGSMITTSGPGGSPRPPAVGRPRGATSESAWQSRRWRRVSSTLRSQRELERERKVSSFAAGTQDADETTGLQGFIGTDHSFFPIPVPSHGSSCSGLSLNAFGIDSGLCNS